MWLFEHPELFFGKCQSWSRNKNIKVENLEYLVSPDEKTIFVEAGEWRNACVRRFHSISWDTFEAGYRVGEVTSSRLSCTAKDFLFEQIITYCNKKKWIPASEAPELWIFQVWAISFNQIMKKEMKNLNKVNDSSSKERWRIWWEKEKRWQKIEISNSCKSFLRNHKSSHTPQLSNLKVCKHHDHRKLRDHTGWYLDFFWI